MINERNEYTYGKDFMKRLIVLLGLSLVFSGCATGAKIGAMSASVTETTIIGNDSVLRNTIEVAEVSGGKETNPLWLSRVSNENFHEALVMSLAVHTMLEKDDSAELQLHAEITDLKQPFIGFAFTVTALVRYLLIDIETSDVLFDRLIETSYTAKFSDALDGTKRMRLANEGAVRTNIEEFIRQLISEADTNPVFNSAVRGT